jgi:hypothetical protein
MPVLPSGRRVEFSLDRFHALLRLMDAGKARQVAENMRDPDDLLFVLDAVHFSLEDGSPYFAGYVASDWKICTSDWKTADREALQAWLASPDARAARAEAIRYIQSLVRGGHDIDYPYALVHDARHVPGSLMRQ